MITTPRAERVKEGAVPKTQSMKTYEEGHPTRTQPGMGETTSSPTVGTGKEDSRVHIPSPHHSSVPNSSVKGSHWSNTTRGQWQGSPGRKDQPPKVRKSVKSKEQIRRATWGISSIPSNLLATGTPCHTTFF